MSLWPERDVLLEGSEVHDILILDGENFGAAQQRSASTLGNERCPRHWHGSLQELPAYQVHPICCCHNVHAWQ